MNATPTFAGGWSNASGSGGSTYEVAIDGAITSWAQLAAIATTSLGVGSTKAWVEASTEILKVVVLRSSTAATNTAEGLQRPNDYNGTTNTKVWHQVAV
jgi:hypothetical protein